MLSRLKLVAAAMKTELAVYRRILKHHRTPRVSRVLLKAAIVYALSPVDIVPDWIPIVGYLDDVIVVPLLVFVALRLVPASVVTECRQRVALAGAAPGTGARPWL